MISSYSLSLFLSIFRRSTNENPVSYHEETHGDSFCIIQPTESARSPTLFSNRRRAGSQRYRRGKEEVSTRLYTYTQEEVSINTHRHTRARAKSMCAKFSRRAIRIVTHTEHE